eukprot:3442680-Amphidinium_carterae.1
MWKNTNLPWRRNFLQEPHRRWPRSVLVRLIGSKTKRTSTTTATSSYAQTGYVWRTDRNWLLLLAEKFVWMTDKWRQRPV